MNFDGFRDIASNLLTEIETEINKSLNKHKEDNKNNFETEIHESISKATIEIKAEIKNEFKQEFKKYVNDVAKLILEKINSNKSRMKIAEENIDRLQNMPDMTNVISRVTDVEKNFATMKKKLKDMKFILKEDYIVVIKFFFTRCGISTVQRVGEGLFP